MAIQEYVGAVVLEVDGKEIECVSVSNDSNTGYMPVKTMRRKRTISGYCMGIVTHELSVTVPIPVDGDPLDWWKVFDAKLTIYPVSGHGKLVHRLLRAERERPVRGRRRGPARLETFCR